MNSGERPQAPRSENRCATRHSSSQARVCRLRRAPGRRLLSRRHVQDGRRAAPNGGHGIRRHSRADQPAWSTHATRALPIRDDQGTLRSSHPCGLLYCAVVRALVDDFDVSPAKVAEEIETSGAACLQAVVTEDWLKAARETIGSYLPLNGSHELLIHDPDASEGSFVHRLVGDPRLTLLLDSVAAAGCPWFSADGRIDTTLRILAGPGPNKPLWFHYDGTVITFVVPIVIPNAGPGTSGELILCPNRRPYRRSAIANIVEKSVSQNDVYRKRFIRKLGQEGKVVPLVPGNVYLFWGYRTYHATLPCPPDALRATMILHYGALHGGNRMLTAAQSVHRTMRRVLR